MTDHPHLGRPADLARLLGHPGHPGHDRPGHRDPGCDAAFELLDQFVEAQQQDDDVEARFPQVVAHLRDCDACREDAEGLLALLTSTDPPDPADPPSPSGGTT